MKEIERKVLELFQAELLLAKAKMEYNSKYVFGSDDVFIILQAKIKELK